MPTPVTIIRDRQLAIRGALDRRRISLSILADESGLSYDTLKSYFPGWDREKDPVPPVPAQIPGSAIWALCGCDHMPLDLLSWLLPEGFLILRRPTGIDHAEFAARAFDYAASYSAARHPDSENGVDLGPGEQSVLSGKVAELRVAS